MCQRVASGQNFILFFLSSRVILFQLSSVGTKRVGGRRGWTSNYCIITVNLWRQKECIARRAPDSKQRDQMKGVVCKNLDAQETATHTHTQETKKMAV